MNDDNKQEETGQAGQTQKQNVMDFHLKDREGNNKLASPIDLVATLKFVVPLPAHHYQIYYFISEYICEKCDLVKRVKGKQAKIFLLPKTLA